MSKFVMSPGELKNKMLSCTTIPNMILLGNEDLCSDREIEIVTLSQAKRDIANNMAWEDYNIHTLSDIEQRIEEILDSNVIQLDEFIKIEDNKITVGINTDIIDDDAVDKAILMLFNVTDFNENKTIIIG